MTELNNPETPEEGDPFAAENAVGLALITQMRILDMLYAIYTEQNPEKAKMIIERHASGKIIGPLPNFDPEQV